MQVPTRGQSRGACTCELPAGAPLRRGQSWSTFFVSHHARGAQRSPQGPCEGTDGKTRHRERRAHPRRENDVVWYEKGETDGWDGGAPRTDPMYNRPRIVKRRNIALTFSGGEKRPLKSLMHTRRPVPCSTRHRRRPWPCGRIVWHPFIFPLRPPLFPI